MLNISGLSSSASTQARLSSFNSFLILLAQINDLEASNHKINHIHSLTSHKTIIEIKILTIIKIRAEKEIKAEIEAETETEIVITAMKTEAEVKIIDKIIIIINKDLESTATSV